MILTDNEIESRLNSEHNLMNRMAKLTSSRSDPFGISRSNTPTEVVSLPPSIDSLIDNVEDKIKLASAKGVALGLMTESMELLKQRLPGSDIKAKDLSRIATDMNKIATSLNEDHSKSEGSKTQVIIYKPVIMNESHYETVHASE